MTTLFAWGKATSGALGLTNPEINGVSVPQHVESLENVIIHSVSSGKNHTLVCLTDGSVKSCGANDFEQCGRQGVLTYLGKNFT